MKFKWRFDFFKKFKSKELQKAALLLAVGTAAGALVFILDFRDRDLPQGFFLERPQMGEGAREEELEVYSEEGKRKLVISVEEQRLSKEEIRERLEELAPRLETLILGENESLDQIRKPLHLLQEMEGAPVFVEWRIQEGSPVRTDGQLEQEGLPREGVLSELSAKLEWEEEVLCYPIYVRVYPPDYSVDEKFHLALQEAVAQKDQDTQYAAQQELPRETGGMALRWQRRVDKRGLTIILLALIGAALQIMAGQREQQKREQKKKTQMEMDYPEIVSKLKLYMEAGLTCRAAWVKIAGDYQKQQKEGQAGERYAYEEMVKTGYEMQSGVGELKAYERFAQRCQAPCYKKLTGLLIQNIRKGNRGLGTMLETEMWQAFEQRKDLARKQGEEAGTKLLLPMVGMLGVVMVIVIAPALMSMRI